MMRWGRFWLLACKRYPRTTPHTTGNITSDKYAKHLPGSVGEQRPAPGTAVASLGGRDRVPALSLDPRQPVRGLPEARHRSPRTHRGAPSIRLCRPLTAGHLRPTLLRQIHVVAREAEGPCAGGLLRAPRDHH